MTHIATDTALDVLRDAFREVALQFPTVRVIRTLAEMNPPDPKRNGEYSYMGTSRSGGAFQCLIFDHNGLKGTEINEFWNAMLSALQARGISALYGGISKPDAERLGFIVG